jgi:undecaprenyl-phosphate galactose phosphotransferase
MNYRKILSFLSLIVFDVIILIISYLLGYLLRGYILSLLFHTIAPQQPFQIFISRFYLIIPYILVFSYDGLYTKRFEFWEETRRLWKSSLVATAIVMIILFVTKTIIVSRAIIIIAFLISLILLPIGRNFFKKMLFRLHLWYKNVLIISSKPIQEKLLNEINRHPILGYKPILFTDNIPLNDVGINEILTREKIDSIVVDAHEFDQTKILELYNKAEGKVEDFFVIPALSQLQTAGVEMEQMESTLLMKFHYNLLRTESQVAKRLLDLFIAGIGFIIALPLILILTILVKLTSAGPIFFIQKRLGKNRKLFPCYKFRTMYLDAPDRLENLLNSSSQAKTEWEKYLKITNDPRVTPLGKFLRRTSLDELPQLWNVIKSEMSLVGPRPYLPHEVENMEKKMGIITRVKPGITGLWQVSGRSQLTFEERLQLDEYYVKNWSIWTDLVIMVKTIRVFIKTEGAY